MAKHIGQVAGVFSPYYELKNSLGSKAKKITKVGIQLPIGDFVRIDDIEFEIGKNGILEFEDVEIKSIKARRRVASDRTPMFVIMDCIYDDLE